MTATSAPPPRLNGPGWVVANTATITARNLRRLQRVPTLVVFATVQPVLFVLLFTYTLGGAVGPPDVEHYIDYLLPGIYVLALAFGASQTGVAIAEDLATGMIDRFRVLPMASTAVLAGRAAADAIRNLFVLALMTAVAAAIGFRYHAGLPAFLAAVALTLTVGLAFTTVNALFGLLIRDAESAGLAGLLTAIPLIFTSSTFVPTHTMPAWLHPIADHNPVTVTVDALRALILGGPAATPVLHTLAWTTAILTTTTAGAALRYRHTTAT